MAAAAAWAILAGATTARAQEAERPPDVSGLMAAAAAALEAEDYRAALEAFAAAHELSGEPVLLFNIAMCHRAVPDWPRAVDAFRRYLEAGAASEPADRLAEAERLIREMEASLASLVADVTEPGAVVLVDGVEIGTSPLDRAVRVPAGSHVVEARKDGFVDARVQLTVGAGESRLVTLALMPSAPPPAPPDVAGPVPPPAAPADVVAAALPERQPAAGEDAAGPDLPVWFWVSAGVAGASAIAAAATGGAMLVEREDYLDGGRRDADLYDTAVALRTATDVLAGVALAAAVAALIGWLTAPEEDDPSATETSAAVRGALVSW
jgi:tetratricopeptide (TPR) repeat protein